MKSAYVVALVIVLIPFKLFRILLGIFSTHLKFHSKKKIIQCQNSCCILTPCYSVFFQNLTTSTANELFHFLTLVSSGFFLPSVILSTYLSPQLQSCPLFPSCQPPLCSRDHLSF